MLSILFEHIDLWEGQVGVVGVKLTSPLIKEKNIVWNDGLELIVENFLSFLTFEPASFLHLLRHAFRHGHPRCSPVHDHYLGPCWPCVLHAPGMVANIACWGPENNVSLGGDSGKYLSGTWDVVPIQISTKNYFMQNIILFLSFYFHF